MGITNNSIFRTFNLETGEQKEISFDSRDMHDFVSSIFLIIRYKPEEFFDLVKEVGNSLDTDNDLQKEEANRLLKLVEMVRFYITNLSS